MSKKEIATSPDRNTFQKNNFLERQAEKGLTPDNDEHTKDMFDYYESWTELELKREADPEWQKDNLEYDLRTTDWIVDKVKSSEAYSQNLYAAFCNNEFIKNDVWPILKEQKWSCSWRYAGGIVAHMRGEGDYIDWYCSGIRGTGYDDDEVADQPTDECGRKYVPECEVTDEIRNDLLKLGWVVVEDSYEFE